MPQLYNIYCDESCHLENDHNTVMVLGAIWCPADKVRETSARLREIKRKFKLSTSFETKWTKVSPGLLGYYLDVLDFFFDDGDLHFRALIVPDKTKLRHEDFNQTHDNWYYKMYFDMLKVLLSPQERYRIYLDYKDTHGASKVHKLHEVLCNNMYDFSRQIIENVQLVRSHEVEQVQLADFLIGIISYANRQLQTSQAKLALVQRMRERSTYRLTQTTLLRENKVNLFRWHPLEEN